MGVSPLDAEQSADRAGPGLVVRYAHRGAVEHRTGTAVTSSGSPLTWKGSRASWQAHYVRYAAIARHQFEGAQGARSSSDADLQGAAAGLGGHGARPKKRFSMQRQPQAVQLCLTPLIIRSSCAQALCMFCALRSQSSRPSHTLTTGPSTAFAFHPSKLAAVETNYAAISATPLPPCYDPHILLSGSLSCTSRAAGRLLYCSPTVRRIVCWTLCSRATDVSQTANLRVPAKQVKQATAQLLIRCRARSLSIRSQASHARAADRLWPTQEALHSAIPTPRHGLLPTRPQAAWPASRRGDTSC